MPQPAELASTAAMLSFIYTGVRYLRATQPDPNPAIEAREAAAAAAAAAAEQLAGAPVLSAVPAPEERRHDALPFVGQDRRAAELARDAESWRRSA